MHASVLPAAQGAAAFTQTFCEGLPTAWHPYPFGQSAPESQGAVQYCCTTRHAKLHCVAVVQGRPTSLRVQRDCPPKSRQRAPCMHCAFVVHAFVHRDGPPMNQGLQSAELHSASLAQLSSKRFVPGVTGPPSGPLASGVLPSPALPSMPGTRPPSVPGGSHCATALSGASVAESARAIFRAAGRSRARA